MPTLLDLIEIAPSYWISVLDISKIDFRGVPHILTLAGFRIEIRKDCSEQEFLDAYKKAYSKGQFNQ